MVPQEQRMAWLFLSSSWKATKFKVSHRACGSFFGKRRSPSISEFTSGSRGFLWAKSREIKPESPSAQPSSAMAAGTACHGVPRRKWAL